MTGAPFLGGYLQHWFSWHASFVFLTLYALVILLLISLFLPETNQHKHKDRIQWHYIKFNFSHLFTSRLFLPYAFIIFATYACVVAWLTSGPILLQHQYGLSPVGFGWLCIMIGGVYALGSLSNARLLNHYQAQTLLKFGVITLCVGSGLIVTMVFILKPSVWTVFIPVLVMLLGASFVFPNAYANLLTPFAKNAGMAGAITTFLQILGSVFASWIISYARDASALPMGITALCFAIFSYAAFRFCPKVGHLESDASPRIS